MISSKNFGLGVTLQIWGHFGSNFKLKANYAYHISKGSSWYQLFRKASFKVIRGQSRSKIAKNGSNFNISKIRFGTFKSYKQFIINYN